MHPPDPETLPPEILSLILTEAKRTISFREFCDLRLLSPTFATVIEPLAFSSVKIAPYQSLRFVAQTGYLKAGNTPSSRWATKLTIDQGGHGDFSNLSDTGAIKPPKSEEQYLIPAIETLVNVKTAAFGLYPTHPYGSVLRALSHLPSLEELKITFQYDGSTFEGVFLPPCTFAKLTALKIVGVDLVPSIVDSLRAMLLRHAEGLESLALRTPFSGHGSTVDDVLVLSLETLFPPSLPRLTSLTFNSGTFHLSPSTLSALPLLSHLIVEEAVIGTVHPSFWKELSNHGIQLKTLSIYPITTPILQYLQSYSGLVELRLSGSPYSRPRGPVWDEAKGKAFDEALSMHRVTLRRLAYENLSWRKYGVTEERLRGVLECKGLETLWLTYHFPDDSREAYSGGWGDSDDESPGEDDDEAEGMGGSSSTMDMMQLLSSLASSLPHLEHLTLEAKRTIPDLGWCGNAYDGYRDNMAKAFGEMVRGAEAAVNAGSDGTSDGPPTTTKCRFRIECLPLCTPRWRDGHPFVI